MFLKNPQQEMKLFEYNNKKTNRSMQIIKCQTINMIEILISIKNNLTVVQLNVNILIE